MVIVGHIQWRNLISWEAYNELILHLYSLHSLHALHALLVYFVLSPFSQGLLQVHPRMHSMDVLTSFVDPACISNFSQHIHEARYNFSSMLVPYTLASWQRGISVVNTIIEHIAYSIWWHGCSWDAMHFIVSSPLGMRNVWYVDRHFNCNRASWWYGAPSCVLDACAVS